MTLRNWGFCFLVLPLPNYMALRNCRSVTLFALETIHSNDPTLQLRKVRPNLPSSEAAPSLAISLPQQEASAVS